MALPIDEHLPSLLASLRRGARRVILEAPPGAGKTTRVPPALLEEDWCTGQVLVSEPRRIAARLSASRVAQEAGCRVGERIGYQVRFDDKTSAATRVVYLTEGLLLRRVLDGGLDKVSVVILDEVHERSAELDQLLALLIRMQGSGNAFRLILMSATLDVGELETYLPDAVNLRSEGRAFDVSLEYQKKEDDRPLPIQVRGAVRSRLNESGDSLVFLPGGKEIRACEDALKELSGVRIIPLHGDLPIEQQAMAVADHGDEKRVVLSTNVAESSLTIPGVTTVIDSGLARTAIFDPWAGVKRLETIKVSQSRCIQRAGRAGRVAPGHCVRLYTLGDFSARPAQDKPELLRSDLSDAYLRLLTAAKDQWLPEELPWLTAPAPEAWLLAKELLERLGAINSGRLTDIGRAMAALPLPPRLARVLVESALLDDLDRGALATALLSERDILRRRFNVRSAFDVVAGDSDLEDRIDRFEQLAEDRFNRGTARDLDLDLPTAQQVKRSAQANRQVARAVCRHLPRQSPSSAPTMPSLVRALLSGFQDRVGARRGRGRDVILASGLQAQLDENSCVADAALVLALSTDAPGGRVRKPLIRQACRLEADWLLDLDSDALLAQDELIWEADKERVRIVSRLSYGKVVLDETNLAATPGDACASVLKQAALTKGAAVFDPEGRLENLRVRLQTLQHSFPELFSSDSATAPSLPWLDSTESLESYALGIACLTRSTLRELREAHLATELLNALPFEMQNALRNETPESVTLAGGHRLAVHYEDGRSPWIESRLQDFFSMTQGPMICAGRVPLQLHLLAPNKRAVQVTTDLEGFWARHYPDLRKQLMRRYPKHLWPEDGRTAKPPSPGRIR